MIPLIRGKRILLLSMTLHYTEICVASGIVSLDDTDYNDAKLDYESCL